MDSPPEANGTGRYIAGGGRCEACLAPVARSRSKCERCRAYDRGYADAVADTVHVLLIPAVQRAARLSDADELATALGYAVAEGESKAFDWPVAPGTLADLSRALGGER
jgi:hypothetical protein